jgi:hypothetical protein
MNDELRDFETQLRRMLPVSCDHLKDDAMYRAGWNAAQAVQALRSHTVLPKKKSIATFAKGLICGVLCCGVSLMAWQFHPVEQSRQLDSVIVLNDIVPPVDAVTNSATVAGDDALVVQPQNTLSSFSALLVPWLNSLNEGSVDVTPSAAKPLSVAARHQWSQMVLSDSTVLVTHQGSTESTTDDEQKFPCLRTRPLRDVNMNDLM